MPFFSQHRVFLRWATVLVISALFTTAGVATAAEDQLSETALKRLLAGELVIYFRHPATTWSGIDRIEWPRERQRLLSPLGIAQSQQIGTAISDLGAPVGEVLASPFARCRDMAEMAFGRVEERYELLGLLSDASGRAERVAFLRTRLSTPTGGVGNRILVSHRSNIAEVAGVALAEGDAVLVLPGGNRTFEVLGILRPEDWEVLAQKQTSN